MATYTPPVLLPASPFPDTQRYGLFKVAVGPLPLPDHAGSGGIEYQTPNCVLPHGNTINCPPNTLTPLTDQLGLVVGTPFLVFSDIVCGTLGHSQPEWNELTLQRLVNGEQATVERMFSDGLNGLAPSLANNTPNVTLLAPVTTISAAIDALEAQLYSVYGPAGILHIPISANSAVYSDYHILRDTDGILYTPMGTRVVFGNYSGNGVDGTPPATGHTTFYITGQMAIWRATEPFLSPYGPSIDKVTNQIHMFAEREYVLAYECYAYAVDVVVAGQP